MDSTKSTILDLKAEDKHYILSQYNLSEPGRMDEAIGILNDWIKQQPHFNKKNFPRSFLESYLVCSKGSIEKVKQRLDKLCTMKTLLRHEWGVIDVSKDLRNLKDFLTVAVLPKTTKELYRVFFIKLHNDQFLLSDYINFFKFTAVITEYVRMYDYADGHIYIYDLSAVNVFEVAKRIDLVATKNIASMVIDCFGFRMKYLYIISESKVVSSLVAILKQVLTKKLGSRIHIVKNINEIFDVVDQKILTEDYGGEEKSLKELCDMWYDILSSKENLQCLEDLSAATADESLRIRGEFDSLYSGVTGTFRSLQVD